MIQSAGQILHCCSRIGVHCFLYKTFSRACWVFLFWCIAISRCCHIPNIISWENQNFCRIFVAEGRTELTAQARLLGVYLKFWLLYFLHSDRHKPHTGFSREDPHIEVHVTSEQSLKWGKQQVRRCIHACVKSQFSEISFQCLEINWYTGVHVCLLIGVCCVWMWEERTRIVSALYRIH